MSKGPDFGLSMTQMDGLRRAFASAAGACADLRDIADKSQGAEARDAFDSLRSALQKVSDLWEEAGNDARTDARSKMDSFNEELGKLVQPTSV